jgi:hypothetical protein
VTLTVADKEQSTQFNVLPDPRVSADGVTLADLQEQYDLSCKLRDFMVEARLFQADLQKSMNEWNTRLASGKKLTGKEKTGYERFMVLYRKVITETGISYPQPMLIDQISTLNSQLGGADQKPGKDLYTRFGQLREQLYQSKNEHKALISR